MKKMLVLDIDQTLVDSSIRENLSFFRDELNLEHYKKQKFHPVLGIASDSLLPLGHWLEANAKKYDFVLCTARQFEYIDFEYIDFESLYALMPSTLDNALHIMCRNNSLDYGGNTCEASNKYKLPLLNWVKANYNRELVVIDDCRKVLDMAALQGHKIVDARDLWHMSESDIMGIIENAIT